MQNLIQFWVYGTFPAALLLLVLFPAFLSAESLPLGLIYLQIPFYLLHQVEEHASGRFGRFVNQTFGHGKEILTPTAIFWINVPGVWGISLTSFLLACFLHPGFGLIPVYGSLLNGLTHLLAWLRWRQPNPGLFTALFLFLPLGGLTLWSLSRQPEVTLGFHLLGIFLALLIHLALVLYFIHRFRQPRGSKIAIHG